MLKKVGEKWYVLDSSGKKVLGKHKTKKKAISQLSAIEISKKERMEGVFPSFSLFMSEEIKSTLEYHQTLNPKIWEGFDLKTEVREKLIEIGNAWAEWAKIPVQAIKDMILVGGNANYNYTPKSDIDLHLLIDVDAIPDCPAYIDEYLKDKKQLWSLTHDIKIYDQPVEVYAQDMNDGFVQDQGVFSIGQNTWLTEPVYKDITLDDVYTLQKVQDYIDQINNLIDSNADDSAFEKLKKKFREMRSEAIKSGGEFSQGNLIFKELRNLGYLDRITNYLRSRANERLSL
jgi:hypothetical protein